MTDDLTLVRRAELRERAEWIREHTTTGEARILVPVDEVLALLDQLDAAEQAARDVEYLTAERDQLLADQLPDMLGREVETPEGHTFPLVCGSCASGMGCRAHPDGWDEPRTEADARRAHAQQAILDRAAASRARRDAALADLMGDDTTEDPDQR